MTRRHIRQRTTPALIAASVASASCLPVAAGFVEYDDKSEWISVVGGDFTTLDFVFEVPQVLNDQYADLGVLFPDGNDTAGIGGSFVNDGWGARGQNGPGGNPDIHVAFDTPQSWIAIDFPGTAQFLLLSEGELIYESTIFDHSGAGFFAGVVSPISFDQVFIRDPTDLAVAIDDLHFGGPVPGPGTLAVVALAPMIARRRRRAR